jgi:hypothetical protein
MIPDLKLFVQTPEQLYVNVAKFNADVLRTVLNSNWKIGQDIYNAWCAAFYKS